MHYSKRNRKFHMAENRPYENGDWGTLRMRAFEIAAFQSWQARP
jgi:hypothetical protein